MKPDRRANPLPYTCWGLFNWGIPRGVYRTRRLAFKAAETSLGRPGDDWRKYFEVHRVMVQKSDVRPAQFTPAGKPKTFKRSRHRALGLPISPFSPPQ